MDDRALRQIEYFNIALSRINQPPETEIDQLSANQLRELYKLFFDRYYPYFCFFYHISEKRLSIWLEDSDSLDDLVEYQLRSFLQDFRDDQNYGPWQITDKFLAMNSEFYMNVWIRILSDEERLERFESQLNRFGGSYSDYCIDHLGSVELCQIIRALYTGSLKLFSLVYGSNKKKIAKLFNQENDLTNPSVLIVIRNFLYDYLQGYLEVSHLLTNKPFDHRLLPVYTQSETLDKLQSITNIQRIYFVDNFNSKQKPVIYHESSLMAHIREHNAHLDSHVLFYNNEGFIRGYVGYEKVDWASEIIVSSKNDSTCTLNLGTSVMSLHLLLDPSIDFIILTNNKSMNEIENSLLELRSRQVIVQEPNDFISQLIS